MKIYISFLFILSILNSCFFSESIPTMEDLENTKNEIEVSFDDISEISEEVPEELREGHKELKDLINEGFGWFSSNNKKMKKSKQFRIWSQILKIVKIHVKN